MEVRTVQYRILKWLCLSLLSICVLTGQAEAQKPTYMMKNGRMYIQLPRQIAEPALDSFIVQYDLAELDLKTFIRNSVADSLIKLGWQVEINNEVGFVISKGFEAFEEIGHALEGLFNEKNFPIFPAQNIIQSYGVNKFRSKQPFAVSDSTVTFFLRQHRNARQVMLAGSFNDWSPEKLAMSKVDSGWIAQVKLGPGKHFYKFVVDGGWTVDNENELKENDGRGNINSVYFKPNVVLTLPGFDDAKKIFVAGSFNGWKDNEVQLMKTPGGWQVPMYLNEGTHRYKFIVDRKWITDPNNNDKLPDGHGNFNSVLRLGKPHIFTLAGFENAKQVILAGSFNDWRTDELFLKRTANGWELPFNPGPGNFEYKFYIDGKWISDPGNPLNAGDGGNSFLIMQPNYTFRLNGFQDAKQVFLAGDFNNWAPNGFLMKKEGGAWTFPVHLSMGKHLYKFVVDGKWIIDPDNKLWEQNEHNSGNSVVWIEK